MAKQELLQALGVSVWYSRKQLVGAAASPVFVVPQQAQVSGRRNEGGAGVAQPLEDVSRDHLLNTLKGLDQEVTTEHETAVSEVAHEGGASDVPVVEIARHESFVLRAYSLAGTAVVTASADRVVVEREKELLMNIVRAIVDSSNNSEVLKDGCEFLGKFSWPVFSSKAISERNDALLGATLSTWCNNVTSTEAKARISFLPASLNESLSGAFESERQELLKVHVGYSLADLLNIPSTKALAWRQLSSQLPVLRKVLKSDV